MSGRAKLAVDIGGTFTDLVLEKDGTRHQDKLLTTPAAPEEAVLEGTRRILSESNTPASNVELVIHGTTLATNALIERKGAETGLIATDGFRDSVEIAYEHRFEQYDLYMERPSPLVPRHRRLGVPERIAADGEVLLPLDEDVLAKRARALQGEGIEALAICFLHSYMNAAHEERARDIVSGILPDIAISISSEICPEIREYERMSTVCANAYVQPMMSRYLGRLESGLAKLGLHCPLLLMMSSGGITTVETASRQPIRLVESGPAGGAILAKNIAAQNNLDKVLSFDMGGTTAKITLIDACEPLLSRSFEVARAYRFLKGSGLPLRIPVIEMVEIGAGGGSVAALDDLKQITVGPESAGSDPGPACYDRGNEHATVTDADLVLGRIEPATFAGGKINLAPDKAETAITTEIATPLCLNKEVAAAGIDEIVNENMANAARVHAIEHGKDIADRTLIAFGGAAPLHAARLADKLGIDRVIVPTGAGVGSAVGFLLAPIAYEVVRTRLVDLRQFDPDYVNEIFDDMRSEAEAVVRMGAATDDLIETRTAYMRYRGQGHEITVRLPSRQLTADDRDLLQNLFDEAYAAHFTRTIPNLNVEILSWTLTLATESELPSSGGGVSTQGAPAPAAHRRLFDPASGNAVDAAIYRRLELEPGQIFEGPAILTEDETSTVIPPNFKAMLNALGEIELLRKES
ncbi:MAG: hydantoinase/oxoprolinase family protein [Pseudomonadota bacterium]|nr:hydantoinase/oxoprolinase family protein [Pseudomonadota bacterium]